MSNLFGCLRSEVINTANDYFVKDNRHPVGPKTAAAVYPAKSSAEWIDHSDFRFWRREELVLHPSPKYIQVESIHCSPAGHQICLHYAPNGDRTSFDTEMLKDKWQTHEGAFEVAWDPSGSFLVSTVVSDLDLVDEDYWAAVIQSNFKMFFKSFENQKNVDEILDAKG